MVSVGSCCEAVTITWPSGFCTETHQERREPQASTARLAGLTHLLYNFKQINSPSSTVHNRVRDKQIKASGTTISQSVMLSNSSSKMTS